MLSSSWEWILKQINNPILLLYIIFAVLVYLAMSLLKTLHFDEVLKSIKTWLTNEKKIGSSRFWVLLIILVLCFGGACLMFMAIMVNDLQKTNSEALTDYFSIKYQNEIQPKSEIEIAQIVNETKSISNISEKLERIAEWETNNFTDIYWHHVSMKSLVPYMDSYVYESNGKIRATHSYINTPYAEDPYWIQYYKFGACGEEASLFANVTNRTGIVTRFVVLDLGYWYKGIPCQTGNHIFVEVKINENDWYYFDPTVYGADHVLNESPCKNGKDCRNRWFGKPEQYDYFADYQVLRVYLRETNEDASERYLKLSTYIKKSKMPLRFSDENISLPQFVNNKQLQLESFFNHS